VRGLYAIIDPEVCLGEPLALAKRVLRGGCAALQLRDKRSDDAQFLALGRGLADACRARGVPFIVNDRFWLAAELQASGVHVGQADAAIERVRQSVGAGVSIGVSARTLEQALDAERRGADLIGFGPVFATATRLPVEPAVGLAALADVCRALRLPVVAIGGVTIANAAAVASSGAAMGAVISALAHASDPQTAARDLHAALRGA
jgi:thiamine-phosphate pyrophosphorylase